MTNETEDRGPRGRFAKGHSIGTPGRPRGSNAKRFRELVGKAIPDIVAKCVEMAKEGDTTAQKIVLDRYFPQRGAIESELFDRLEAAEAVHEQLEEAQQEIEDLKRKLNEQAQV